MKIALVGPVYPYRGGIAHYTSMLARALREQRHDTLVVSYRRQYPALLYPGESDREASASGGEWQVEAEYLIDSIWPPTWWQAAERVRRFEAELVVLQWWTTFMAPLSWLLARRLRAAGRQVVFVIHNVLPHEPRLGDTWLTRQTLAQARGYLVQSESELRRLRALLPGAEAVVAAHPIQRGFGAARVPADAARQALGLPAGVTVILFFGMVRAYKGLHVLLQAVARLHASGDRPYLVVAGEFWDDRSGYEAQVRALGLRDYVHMAGRYVPNEDVPLYFSAADVFAAPYVGGTQSAAIKVALGFGVPIVTTRPEDVSAAPPGPLGAQVVAAGDAEALAAALHEALAAKARLAGRPLPELTDPAVGDWNELARVVAGLAARA